MPPISHAALIRYTAVIFKYDNEHSNICTVVFVSSFVMYYQKELFQKKTAIVFYLKI